MYGHRLRLVSPAASRTLTRLTAVVPHRRRCDARGGGCVTIAGARTASYVVRPSDRGHGIRALVTVWNHAGHGVAASRGVLLRG